MARRSNGVRVQSGRAFYKGSTGKWAGERMLAAAAKNIPLTAAVLRTLDTLRHEEWKNFDQALLAEALIQLKAVGDLISGGLTITVPNSMGKTIHAYEKVTFMDEAQVSMDPVTRSENDRQEFALSNIPLPITHKDFYINLRTLMASRTTGEPLDTTQVRTAGRVVAERTEKMLFLGGPMFGGLPIYGYLTHPNRNLVSFGSNGNWATTNVAKTGQNILDDVLGMISAAQTARMFGPYWLYVPRNSNTKLDNDFKALGSDTIRQRLMMVDGIDKISGVDQLTANNIVLVQHTLDVTAMLMGESLQTVQWDIEGGFHINFKAFQIQVPLIRADIQGRCGVVHMS